MTQLNDRGRGETLHADPAANRRILSDPAFRELVAARSSFAWGLSALMLAVYLAFILLVAFAHDVMATKIGDGPTSVGIVLGLAVIVFAFLLTGVYVARANSRFDDLTARVRGMR